MFSFQVLVMGLVISLLMTVMLKYVAVTVNVGQRRCQNNYLKYSIVFKTAETFSPQTMTPFVTQQSCSNPCNGK